MFNLGASEIFMIGLVALIFIPPKKLPEIAIGLGRFIAQLRHALTDVKSQVEKGIKDEMNKTQESPKPKVTLLPPENKEPKS